MIVRRGIPKNQVLLNEDGQAMFDQSIREVYVMLECGESQASITE